MNNEVNELMREVLYELGCYVEHDLVTDEHVVCQYPIDYVI